FGDPALGVRKWCEVRPTTTTTPATTPTPEPVPSNTQPPVISGRNMVGKTLTTSQGTWQGNPTSFAYAWSRCDTTAANCTIITGATASTYVLVSADSGRTLVATVIASSAAGTGFANSAPTPVIR